MKRLIAFGLASLLGAVTLHAQPNVDGEGDMGMGTNNPDPSAILDLNTSNKGVLIPRMTSAQRDAIPNPAAGLIIFNTDLNTIEFNIGAPGSPTWATIATLDDVGSGGSGNDTLAWKRNGNSTNGTDFLGTTNGQPLAVRTNDQERLRIDTAGNVGVGTTSPVVSMDVNGALAVRSGTTVDVTSDDQEITVGNRSYIRLTSDTADYLRTITLTDGLVDGQMLVLEVLADCDDGIEGPDGPDGIEIDDISNGSEGNVDLRYRDGIWGSQEIGSYSMYNNSTLTLIWDGEQSLWIELSRSMNQECLDGGPTPESFKSPEEFDKVLNQIREATLQGQQLKSSN